MSSSAGRGGWEYCTEKGMAEALRMAGFVVRAGWYASVTVSASPRWTGCRR